MRVLVVKTSSMGDVLHTLPALTDAMQAMPDIRFDWVVEEGFAQIPSWHPAVERVLPVAIRRWRKAWFSAPVKAERRAFRDALRAVNYDAVIDAQGLVKSAALVTRLARGVKHGMDWQTAREPLASLFYHRRHHIAKAQHAVERTRELFAKSLGYAKPAAQGDYAIAQHFCASLRTTPGVMSCSCTPPRAMKNTGRKRTGASLSHCWARRVCRFVCRGARRTKKRGPNGLLKVLIMCRCSHA